MVRQDERPGQNLRIAGEAGGGLLDLAGAEVELGQKPVAAVHQPEGFRHRPVSLADFAGLWEIGLDPRVQPDLPKARKICQAYRTVAKTFGLMDSSDGLLTEFYLRAGEIEQAAASFARYAEVLTGPLVLPDQDLFSPGLTCAEPEAQQSVSQQMCRMLLQSISSEEKYRPLFASPVFMDALEKLRASI